MPASPGGHCGNAVRVCAEVLGRCRVAPKELSDMTCLTIKLDPDQNTDAFAGGYV